MFIRVIVKAITMLKRSEMLSKNESRVFDATELSFEEMRILLA